MSYECLPSHICSFVSYRTNDLVNDPSSACGFFLTCSCSRLFPPSWTTFLHNNQNATMQQFSFSSFISIQSHSNSPNIGNKENHDPNFTQLVLLPMTNEPLMMWNSPHQYGFWNNKQTDTTFAKDIQDLYIYAIIWLLPLSLSPAPTGQWKPTRKFHLRTVSHQPLT